MISGNDYRASLDDGRAVWLDGKRVADVTTHPLLRKSVDWIASSYDESGRRERTRCTACPGRRTSCASRCDVLLSSDRTAATTAGCMALATAADQLSAASTAYGPRLERFAAECRDRDRRVAAAIDDTARPVRDRRTPRRRHRDRRRQAARRGGAGRARAARRAVGPRRRRCRGRVRRAGEQPGGAAHRVDDRASGRGRPTLTR